jgi:hypothetical protein
MKPLHQGDTSMNHTETPKIIATMLAAAIVIALAVGLTVALAEPAYCPAKGTELVKVEGQAEPLPSQWLQSEAAKDCACRGGLTHAR